MINLWFEWTTISWRTGVSIQKINKSSDRQGMSYGNWWIQYENWWNVFRSGAEGRSLQRGGCSSLPVVAGKREKVVAFCRWVPACWYKSAPAYIVRSFLYNKYWRLRLQQQWFSPELGFHLNSWCSYVLFMFDGLFCYFYSCLMLIWCNNLNKDIIRYLDIHIGCSTVTYGFKKRKIV